MNNIVLQIGQMNFRGNVIDHGWFKTLTLDNGKPNMVAISILGEVVYWYKPTEVRDEHSNNVRYKQKFKADTLQKSYQQFADSFGFTKRQVKDACDYLKDRRLVRIEFRTVFVNGTRCNNVMFIEPIPEEIQKISILYWENGTPPTLERKRVLQPNVPPSYDKTEEPPTFKRKTNTKITTKNTTENVSSSSIFSFYENNFGILNSFVAENISQWINDTNEELVQAAMERALKQQKKWNYAEGILKQWVNNNVKTLKDVDALETEYQRNKGVKKRVGINRKSDDSDSEYIGL
ncbi:MULTISPECIES: DnaD domain-containing protein [Bacillales]|uniref:DnaD domain protein n=2 Tax=Bacillus cereus group TaxID=86661 RepID=A0A5M9GT88_9BACI|nr:MULTISPECIES: DnaD domain protein [Bacillales]ACJ80146.1 putative prophage LambdaBa04, DnaD replication protein [Bacillus cereus AH187]EJP97042.1 DnaD domain-containing protein [Bacillus cereus IS075]EJR21297.1 DnaD and phage-associated domain-containing protein [Bacillus cereus MSX-A12]EOO88726.1 DnaD and phage-associated domain-containing protein [Bacillus cereus IS845/00]EOO97209.1 DnaD and phage-associated domain-containing protein [Bacillus cereus IS195]KFK74406.1 DnaD domain protein 